MKLNADLSRTAFVDGAAIPWVASPMPGVERRMLERDGEEVARATSLVRYAAGSRFSEHTHVGGEEFFVLEGTFSDESGDYPAGSYVHNPVGSAHTPHSDEGCVIFVKLYWMHPDDRETVHVETRTATDWRPMDSRGLLDPDLSEDLGVESLQLHQFGHECSELLRLSARSVVPSWGAEGGSELLVLEGSCRVELDGDSRVLAELGWARFPAGTQPRLDSHSGCTLLAKRGHLVGAPALPA